MNAEDDRPVRLSDLITLKSELKGEIASEGARSRRHMDVVAEDLQSQFKVVIDRTEATAKAVERLAESNAVEHAAFVEAIADHEVRLRVIEKIHVPTKPAP